MKKKYIISASLVITLILSSCTIGGNCEKGDGDIKTENRNIESFDAINLSLNAIVKYTQESKTSISIEAQENLLPFIDTKVENNTLYIEPKDCDCVDSDDQIIIYLSSPSLKDISLAGSGDFLAEGLVNSEDLNMDIAGSGSIELKNLNVENYTVDIAGSGDVNLNGSQTSHEGQVSIAGSGDVDISGIITNKVHIDIAGSGDVTVHAKEQLDVEIAGSGDVHYSGNPKLSMSIAGSGDVINE